MNAFAILVRRSRQAAWMTQEELADRSGLSPRTIQAIERGQVRRPQRETVRLLANALNLQDAARDEFETAARLGLPAPAGDPCTAEAQACPALGDMSGCLAQRVRRSMGRVDLHGLGASADPVAVMVRLLRAAGVSVDDYGLAGALVPNHTVPAHGRPTSSAAVSA